ncbi:hypothetical protein LJ655_26620 [Paraburkholderia sp. MMS20-SJTN17]|uniref:CdiI immunity protein domain-containing protein n=1 Tax=Paraburkholderia translucens TaxID=2886945 RepID=A0ABS8KL03_9BURK|nr:contact-dependent growth inhibition system immunity protein [Paraburkholderia sp. MMS20-SJTN17]MCC8405385.1 hypothetical protein [Paraburkholderia sp. MMS20-SJTN17]
MISKDRYPAMRHAINVYFGQDFELFGDTVPEIVARYKRDDSHRQADLIREIDSFVGEHPDDLDAAFERDHGSAFDPQLWGYTTSAFLDELKRLLSEQFTSRRAWAIACRPAHPRVAKYALVPRHLHEGQSALFQPATRTPSRTIRRPDVRVSSCLHCRCMWAATASTTCTMADRIVRNASFRSGNNDSRRIRHFGF